MAYRIRFYDLAEFRWQGEDPFAGPGSASFVPGATLRFDAVAKMQRLDVTDNDEHMLSPDTSGAQVIAFDDPGAGIVAGGKRRGNGVSLSTSWRFSVTGEDGTQITLWGVAMDGETVGIVATRGLKKNIRYTIAADPAPTGPAGAPFSEVNCFSAGTFIRSARGTIPIEELKVGDQVWTLDHGYQPIRWIGRERIASARLAFHPEFRPIRIAAHALGPGTPARDLWVSPQHRVLIASRVVERVLGQPEALIAAKHLEGMPGIEAEPSWNTIIYVHLVFDRHEVIAAEGAWAESLYTGEQALAAVGPDARAEFAAIFPAMATTEVPPMAPARALVPGATALFIAARHLKNEKPLCYPALEPIAAE